MRLRKSDNTMIWSNCTFNQDTLAAFSYDWWQFVKKIDGTVYFNAYHYSSTTNRHQSKVRSILDGMGINYQIIRLHSGLQNISNESVNLAFIKYDNELKEANRKLISKRTSVDTKRFMIDEIDRINEEKDNLMDMCGWHNAKMVAKMNLMI